MTKSNCDSISAHTHSTLFFKNNWVFQVQFVKYFPLRISSYLSGSTDRHGTNSHESVFPRSNYDGSREYRPYNVRFLLFFPFILCPFFCALMIKYEI